MRRITILLVFVLAPMAGAVNDLTNDPNAKAWWRFENGALTTDSNETNTLTSRNSPVADTVNFQEGAASVDLESGDSDYFEIADASLSAGFPCKTGDTNKKISVCWRMKPESVPTSGNAMAVFAKYQVAVGKRGFVTGILYNAGTSPRLFVQTGTGDAANTAITHDSTIVAGTWYHVGVTYDNSTLTATIRIWDAGAGAILGSDKSGQFENSMSIVTTPVTIGSLYSTATRDFDGLIDDVIVFNDILSTGEIDAIRAGTFPPPAGPPDPATSPGPADSATGVKRVHATVTLSWTAGAGATAHDVYFGTTVSPSLVSDDQAGTTYEVECDPLTTYYWKIAEVGPGGDNADTASLWTFTTRAQPAMIGAN